MFYLQGALIEAAAMLSDFFTAQSALGLFILSWIVYSVQLRLQQHWSIKRLGGYAPHLAGYVPFGQRFIFTADPENIKGKGKVFLRDFEEFLGHGIFTTDGEEWLNSRQLLRPQFVQTRVRDLEIFEKHVQQLLLILDGQGTEIDVSKLFYRYTLDAATEFLLGRSANSLGNADSDFALAFDEVQRIQTIRVRSGPFQHFVPLWTFRRGLKVMASFIEPFVQEALCKDAGELGEKEGKESTWLDSVARFTRDRTVIRDQIVNILLAGRDTTAGTLSFLFKELSAQPAIYSKLRQEILEKVGAQRQPNYEDLKDMPYLQHCINETLRMYPAVPYNMRVALKETSLPRGGGSDGHSAIGVLKDTIIGYSPMYLHRESAQYPAESTSFPPVMQFSPERWERWTPRPWQYIPFNGGPRICIGRFAKMEKYWAAEDHWLKSEIVLSPAYGVKVGFHSATENT
ncbi:MAG: hypothetical protein L6R37_003523 [Teloschistes peruensis]|nr:MAG: hypothetical protein L6R37_003523 [Teloschistes peruensis]